MKKALQISIARTLFTIEEDAYAKLETYLSSVKNHFKDTEGSEEIINDIEGRIAEQLLESGEKIVNLSLVDKILAAMGGVGDFGDEEAKEEQSEISYPRKLYRDSEGALLAGVCSGLGAYFGVDAIWIRAGFILSVLLSGFGVILYIVLWFLIPEAKTKVQRLEMKGAPVTLGTLSEKLNETVQERMEEIKQKKDAGKIGLRALISFPFKMIGLAARFFAKAVGPAVRIVLGTILIAGSLAVLCGFMIGSGFFAFGDILVSNNLPLESLLPSGVRILALAGVTLALIIPAFFILLSGISIIRKKNVISLTLGFGLLGVWFVALLFSGFGIAKVANNYQEFTRTSPAYQAVSKDIPLNGTFTKLKVTDGLSVTFSKGDPALRAEGREKDMESVSTRIENGVLVIEAKPADTEKFCLFCFSKRPKLFLSAAALEAVSIEHGSHLDLLDKEIDQLAGKSLMLTMQNGSYAELDLALDSLTLDIVHGSHAILSGKAKNVDMTAKNGSEIEARDLKTETAKISALHGSRAEISVSKKLSATALNGSSIVYQGEPEVEKKTSNGSAIDSESGGR